MHCEVTLSISQKKGADSVLSIVTEQVAQGETEFALLLSTIALAVLFVFIRFGVQVLDIYHLIVSYLPF